MTDKRARQFLIKKVNAPDTEGNWRVDETFIFGFAPTMMGEENFENALDVIEEHPSIATITHSGFNDTHFQIDIKWVR